MRRYAPGVMVFLVLVMLLSACGQSPGIPTDTNGFTEELCTKRYAEIEQQLRDSNYCTSDEDCTTILLGSRYIEFGCYHYVNVEVNKSAIFDKIAEYEITCSDVINECTATPSPVCRGGKCVENTVPPREEYAVRQSTQLNLGELHIGIVNVRADSATLAIRLDGVEETQNVQLAIGEETTAGD